jgi:hypothetical protein
MKYFLKIKFLNLLTMNIITFVSSSITSHTTYNLLVAFYLFKIIVNLNLNRIDFNYHITLTNNNYLIVGPLFIDKYLNNQNVYVYMALFI